MSAPAAVHGIRQWQRKGRKERESGTEEEEREGRKRGGREKQEQRGGELLEENCRTELQRISAALHARRASWEEFLLGWHG